MSKLSADLRIPDWTFFVLNATEQQEKLDQAPTQSELHIQFPPK